MNSTTQRRHPGRVPVPVAPPGRPLRGRPPARLRVLLFRYLAAGFVLVALLAIANPHRPDGAAAAAPAPWAYQREQIDLAGGGALNAYARAAVHATAWLAKGSIERQRDVYRLNLFGFLLGDHGAQALSGWRVAHRPVLETATKLALLCLVGYGILRRPQRRTWVLAVLLLLAVTLVVTRPAATMRAAGATGTAVPNAMLGVVAAVAPGGGIDGSGGAESAQQRLAARYWTAFVGNPLSRMQTGSDVLETAPPTKKGSLLRDLQRNVSAVNDWAIGRRGPERAFIASSALGYVAPFAFGLGILAMIATCAQTVLFLLLVAGLFAVPFAVLGRRQRRLLVRYWALPAAGSIAVLALASLASFVLMRAADALHATDEYVGLLLAGSTGPVVAALLLWRRYGRRGPAAARRSEELIA